MGNKVKWLPIDWLTHEADSDHPWYGASGTVIKVMGWFAQVALDDFPMVNDWENKRRFWIDTEELKVIGVL